MFPNLAVLILTSVLVVFLSLIGGVLLLIGTQKIRILQKLATIFAIIVLLYAVFFDLIPEALEGGLSVFMVILLMITGVAVCFVVGMVAGHFHRHGENIKFKNKKQAYTMLVVDSLHTLTDGVVIGVAFAGGIPTGLVAALATVAHEIPQEIGDFGIMLRSKIDRKTIIKLQVLSGLLLVPAAILAYFIGDCLLPAMPYLMALIAGFFVYIVIVEIINLRGGKKNAHH